MPGLLSRLRRRATSFSLSTTSSTTATTSPQPPSPTPALAHTPTPILKSPLERKIHPDLDSLLASHPLQSSGHTSQDGTLGTVVETRTGEAEPGSSSSLGIAPRSSPGITLRSSPRRHTIDGSRLISRPSDTNLRLTPPSQLEGLPESPPATPASSSRPTTTSTTEPPPRQDQNVPASTRIRNPHLLARITNLATTGEWSTFGRGTREQPEPRLSLGDFVELGPGEESSGSPVRVQEGENTGGGNGGEANFHSHSTFTVPLSTRPASPYNSPSISTPTNSQPTSRTTSHSHHATHHQTPHNPQTPALHNSPSQNDASSFSPHTFGYPTPPAPRTHPVTPSHGSSGFTFGAHSPSSSPLSFVGSLFRRDYGTPPPPLPPLDHPAFRLFHPATTSPDILFPAPQAPDTGATRGSTTHALAQVRSRSRSRSQSKYKQQRVLSSSYSMPSLSRRRYTAKSNTSKSVPTTLTRPLAQDIFSPHFYNSSATSAAQQYHANPSNITDGSANATPFRRSRARTQSTSNNNIRRMSAEFSAQQASGAGNVGDVTAGKTAESWEAQVSREMVRLSFMNGQGESGHESDNGNHASPQNIGQGGQGNNGNRAAEATDPGHETTRGNNQGQTQEGLGPPFLLQDTKKNNLSDIARTLYDLFGLGATNTTAKGKGKEKENVVDIDMSHGGGTDPIGEDTTKAKTPVIDTGAKGKSKSASNSRSPSPPKPTPRPHSPSTPFLQTPAFAFTAPTPEASPGGRSARRTASEPASVLRPSEGEGKAKGKRKADDVEGTPPDTKKEQRATFALDTKPNRASPNSASSHGHAPSSYHRKRARLASPDHSQSAANTGSWSSRGSQTPQSGQRPGSRGSAARAASTIAASQRTPSRRSISQVSIPISALISPHAPSLSRSSTFHMRNPHRPAPVQPTPWSLHFASASAGEAGSPVHAWLFFMGFILFPLWWIAGFLLPIPRTRRVGESEVEKGVVLDDPQVEFDAKSWRTRCRIVSVVSIFTYIPFIVLIAIFV